MSNKKKKSNTKKIIITISVFTVLGLIIGFIIGRQAVENKKLSALCDYTWVPSTANNASGDEVELAEIYDTNYTSYQGSMIFEDDGKFSLWLRPGDPSDGTHSGTYILNGNKCIDVTFDNGATNTYELKYTDDEITAIIVDYNNYEVCFVRQ